MRTSIVAALAVLLSTVMQPALAEGEGTPPTQDSASAILQRDQAIDRQTGALADPLILRVQLQPAPSWPAPQGLPPYDQAPLNANQNFCLQKIC